MFPRKRRGLISQGPAPTNTGNPEVAPENPPPSTPPKKAQEDGLYSNGKWYCTSFNPIGNPLNPKPKLRPA